MYIKGSQVEFSKLWCISALKVVSLLENSVLCCISSGSLLFAKVPVYGLPVYKDSLYNISLYFSDSGYSMMVY